MRVANRIWVERSQEENLVPTYRERSAEWYGAGAGFVDFLGAPEDARASINAWVSEQTEAMIPELLAQGSVDASTRAVLTNAVYFLGSWASGFDEEFTTEGPFFTPDAEPSTVRFMTKQADMRYLSREDRQVVGAPYRGFDWALYVVLPAPGELESVGRSLAASGFASGMPRKHRAGRPAPAALPRRVDGVAERPAARARDDAPPSRERARTSLRCSRTTGCMWTT